ncbi:MAG: sensor histidine kinase [Spirochaetota bacterium]
MRANGDQRSVRRGLSRFRPWEILPAGLAAAMLAVAVLVIAVFVVVFLATEEISYAMILLVPVILCGIVGGVRGGAVSGALVSFVPIAVDAAVGSEALIANPEVRVLALVVYTIFGGFVGHVLELNVLLRRTQASVDSAPEAVYWIRSDHRIVYANEAAAEMLGYPRSELIGMGVGDIDAEYGETGRVEPAEDGVSDAGPRLFKRMHRTSDGRLVPVEIAIRFLEFGRRRLRCAYCRDVSARLEAARLIRERERRLREAQEIARVGYGYFVPERDTLRVSGKAAEILGHVFHEGTDGLSPIPVRAMVELFGPGERSRFVRGIAHLVRDDVRYHAVHDITLPDGSSRSIFLHARWDTDDGGETCRSRVIGTIQDVTAMRATERELRTAVRDREVLLREIHHRVKNNMQIVSSLLSLQALRTVDEPAAEILQDGQQRIRAMAHIHELLYRHEHAGSVDVAEYVTVLTDSLRSTYSRQTERVAMRLAVSPVQLPMDTAIPTGLILNELVTNAYKHAFPDGRPGEIEVGFDTVDDAFRFWVGDNGVGIATREGSRAGNSLGMQIVAMLADQLGATLTVSSEAGTRVTVEFASCPHTDAGSPGEFARVDRS